MLEDNNMASNDKVIDLTSKYKPLCDKHNGDYDKKGNDDAFVVTINLTHDKMEKIDSSKEKRKLILDSGFVIDPTWDDKKGKINYRLKQLCFNDFESFYKSLENVTKKNMVRKQHHVNLQKQLRDSMETKLGFVKPNNVSKALQTASQKLAKHLDITDAEALEIIS